MEFSIPLNKFEKETKVIELHSREGKTLKEISKIVKMSFRDISRIIKEYERKKRLESKKREENNQTKKPSLSSQAFKLFREGTKPIDVKIELDIPFKTAMRYWVQYLKSIRMYESFEFYQEHSYDIPAFLSINNFIKRNCAHIKDISTVLMEAKTTANLQLHLSILKNDIERLQKTKNNYLLNQNTNNYQQPLLPLGLPKHYYHY